jgi:hypothetical protein
MFLAPCLDMMILLQGLVWIEFLCRQKPSIRIYQVSGRTLQGFSRQRVVGLPYSRVVSSVFSAGLDSS